MSLRKVCPAEVGVAMIGVLQNELQLRDARGLPAGYLRSKLHSAARAISFSRVPGGGFAAGNAGKRGSWGAGLSDERKYPAGKPRALGIWKF